MLRQFVASAAISTSLVAFAPLPHHAAAAEFKLAAIVQDGARIRLSGDIEQSDAKEFRRFVGPVRKEFQIVILELDSSGGVMLAAMDIGRYVRENSIYTLVRDDDGSRCLSACVIILAGGIARFASGATVGIHRPRFEERYFAGLSESGARAQYRALAGAVDKYLAEMGMSEDLFEMMMRVPSKEIRMLTFKELGDTALDGVDPAHEEWLAAKMIARCGADRAREIEKRQKESLEYFHNCLAGGGKLESCAEETDTAFKDLFQPGC